MLMYTTFVTGLQEPIAGWIEGDKHRIRKVLDGAIIYDSRSTAPMPCFFNTFEVLEQGTGSVEQLMRAVLRKPGYYSFEKDKPHRNKPHQGKTFRIVTSRENQLISVENRLRTDMEKMISSKTGMIPDRRGGGAEFWFLSRSEGITLFMHRKDNKSVYKPKKGELRPELAYCLNRLANPKADDIMVDPFCGYGAIARSRAQHFPCKEIHSLDINLKETSVLHRSSGDSQSPLGSNSQTYKKADISQLPSIFQAQSVDVIVTDPPWGVFTPGLDILALYETFAQAVKHVLKPSGRVVILTAQKELIYEINKKWLQMQIVAHYDILVSGQKAAIFVINASAK